MTYRLMAEFAGRQAEREIHEAGWSLYLGRLVIVAEGGDPGPDPSLRGVE